MRILYYDWDEFNGEDCRDAMKRLGHQVDTIKATFGGFDLISDDEKRFKECFNKRDATGNRFYDLVYSFDYFPNISEVCRKHGVPYVSWVFDCPHYPLFSYSVDNQVNHIYVFDKALFNKMKIKGISTVNYSPLGVNAKRLSSFCEKLDAETGGNIVYQHDVCFLGSLYDNEFNFFDQVDYLPPELRETIELVMQSQEKIFGKDLFSDTDIVPDTLIEKLRSYISFERTGKYDIDYNEVIRDILRKKVTVNERRKILEQTGRNFDTVIYTNPDAKPIEGVCNMGIANYTEKMPMIFHRSKVNLNITLRCITSGVSLRVMDVLAAGGFLVTTTSPEIEEYFTDGVDLAIAHTPEEMLQKTAYYLEHEDERRQIALNGQKKVFEQFAYTKLLPRILSP